MAEKVMFARGCDLTYVKPMPVDIASCISARYDAGICKHRYERSGVVEIYKIDGEQFRQWKKS